MWERSSSYPKVCNNPGSCTLLHAHVCKKHFECLVCNVKGFLFQLFYLDCGAGIGRVTKNLLLPLFDTVDMVEQNPDFLEKAKDYLVSLVSFRSVTHLSCHQSGVEINVILTSWKS